MSDLPYFLTPAQAAKALQVSRDVIYSLITTGRLKASDVSAGDGKRARYRIRREDLMEFVEGGAVVG